MAPGVMKLSQKIDAVFLKMIVFYPPKIKINNYPATVFFLEVAGIQVQQANSNPMQNVYPAGE
jgi:hypothetical protein